MISGRLFARSASAADERSTFPTIQKTIPHFVPKVKKRTDSPEEKNLPVVFFEGMCYNKIQMDKTPEMQ